MQRRPFHKKPRSHAPPRTKPPSIDYLREILEGSGLKLHRDQLEHLWAYHRLLRDRNQDRDLTRIIEFRAMVVKHYVDCLIIGKYTTLPSPLLDIGTGAGFPGIPLKIRYPHLKITLAEPRPNRILFLHEVRKALHLKHLEIFDHKVVSRSFQTPMAGIISRALEVIPKTILRTSACLDRGGILIFMKGPNVDEELRDVERDFSAVVRLREDHPYVLPHSSHQRRLLIYEKLIPREVPAKEVPESTFESGVTNLAP